MLCATTFDRHDREVPMQEEKDGRLVIDEAGHEIYYRLYGSGEETLVGLHGGPGADHRYLTRLGELAGRRRPGAPLRPAR